LHVAGLAFTRVVEGNGIPVVLGNAGIYVSIGEFDEGIATVWILDDLRRTAVVPLVALTYIGVEVLSCSSQKVVARESNQITVTCGGKGSLGCCPGKF